ncbi:transposase [Sinomicrobium sp.]
MSKSNPHIHSRKSIRLKGYDYAQQGLYFITLCVRGRECLFGEIDNGKMVLNSYGQIAKEEWLHTIKVRQNVALHEFIVMPDHLHGIVEILERKEEGGELGKFKSPSHTIGAIVRGYKIATIKRIKDFIYHQEEESAPYPDPELRKGELQFAPTAPTDITEKIKKSDFKIWQRNYYDRIIRNEEAYHHISRYIVNNPIRWEKSKPDKE